MQHRFVGSVTSKGQWSTIWNCLDCDLQHWNTDSSPAPNWSEGYEFESLPNLREELEYEKKRGERLLRRIEQQDAYIARLLN